MTEENYKYRTSPLFLRNQFKGGGKHKIPVVPRFQPQEGDFDDLLLIGFDKIRLEDQRHLGRMVHFFLYDYKFERVWKNPDTDLEKLRRYRAVLTPDFSMYLEMAPVLQLYNTFRNRWCGAYFASKGMRVIPTVSWGDESTFDFCFDGIEKGSAVAVSTYMVSAHGNHSDQKEFFMKGYNEMLRRIEPEKIICYNEPFPEMAGDLVFVDYERSSWRHLNDEPPLGDAAVQFSAAPQPENGELIFKTGYVVCDRELNQKGEGSAYGGSWRPSPNKPDDERFLGLPGTINKSRYEGKKGGYDRETKIGDDGRAIKERHYTDYPNSKYHTNPHDHEIDWSDGFPRLGPPINYPNGAPEFKLYEVEVMSKVGKQGVFKENHFESISDFKWCMHCGGEVLFEYHDKTFGIAPKLQKTPGSLMQMLISQVDIKNSQKTEKWCNTADEVLEYVIDGVRLRDVITEVEVLDRTV